MTRVEFCLLGPTMVRSGGAIRAVPGGKLRSVLAALLLGSGRVVSLEELAEVLWGAEPPPTARVTVQNHVMRLRRVLGTEGDRITTWPHGYRILLDDSELDVSRFEGGLSAARIAARDGSWSCAASAAGQALALWRGDPLADVDSESLRLREVPRLAELHLRALETRINADLHLGRHAEVIPELRQLASSYPLREQFHADLMRALYRDGRQAEALAVYQQARKILVDEVGTEPGSGLREVHRQILAADDAAPASDDVAPAADDAEPATAGTAAVPHELPAAVAHFIGRAEELEALTDALGEPCGDEPRTVIINALSGTAGVGKTALAVRFAHQVAERFPDGQLYVNLRGYDPGQPVPPADALAGFLLSLGSPGQDIPPEAEQRAARYRSMLASKRMLVLLDNAGSADQVRPLLPGSPACAVVVTSRNALAGLVAGDGAIRLNLDVLPLADAVVLLRTLIGQRAADEPDAAAELARQCCRLPLALRVAAELAAARSAMPLAGLVSELADLRTRLDLLDTSGDPRTQVRAVFSWSYRHLDADAARTFRLLGLHPGPGVDPYAAAALSGSTVPQARRALAALAGAHLIEVTGPGRHGIHDLLRGYARELTTATHTEDEQRAALSRLFDYYLYTAAAAMNTMFPAEADRRPKISRPAVSCPAITSIAAARTWLDAERATLAAVASRTATSGWPGHTTRLAATVFRYLEVGGHYAEIIAINDHARRAARDTGDRAAEAEALLGLIVIDLRQGRYQQADDRLRQVLAIYRETGDQRGEARSLGNLGVSCFLQGRYQLATSHLQQALAVYRQTGNQHGQTANLANLALVRLRLGCYEQATKDLEHALALCRASGDRSTEAYVLSNLGVISLRLGNQQQATKQLEHALTLCRDSGNRDCEAYALGNLGIAESRLGNHQQATKHLEHALTLCRENGDRSSEAQALNSLGEILLAAGCLADARAKHAQALDLASQIGDTYEQARAHDGLARGQHDAGDRVRARQHWQQALALYIDLGTPEADRIRTRLSAMSDEGDSQVPATALPIGDDDDSS